MAVAPKEKKKEAAAPALADEDVGSGKARTEEVIQAAHRALSAVLEMLADADKSEEAKTTAAMAGLLDLVNRASVELGAIMNGGRAPVAALAPAPPSVLFSVLDLDLLTRVAVFLTSASLAQWDRTSTQFHGPAHAPLPLVESVAERLLHVCTDQGRVPIQGRRSTIRMLADAESMRSHFTEPRAPVADGDTPAAADGDTSAATLADEDMASDQGTFVRCATLGLKSALNDLRASECVTLAWEMHTVLKEEGRTLTLEKRMECISRFADDVLSYVHATDNQDDSKSLHMTHPRESRFLDEVGMRAMSVVCDAGSGQRRLLCKLVKALFSSDAKHHHTQVLELHVPFVELCGEAVIKMLTMPVEEDSIHADAVLLESFGALRHLLIRKEGFLPSPHAWQAANRTAELFIKHGGIRLSTQAFTRLCRSVEVGREVLRAGGIDVFWAKMNAVKEAAWALTWMFQPRKLYDHEPWCGPTWRMHPGDPAWVVASVEEHGLFEALVALIDDMAPIRRWGGAFEDLTVHDAALSVLTQYVRMRPVDGCTYETLSLRVYHRLTQRLISAGVVGSLARLLGDPRCPKKQAGTCATILSILCTRTIQADKACWGGDREKTPYLRRSAYSHRAAIKLLCDEMVSGGLHTAISRLLPGSEDADAVFFTTIELANVVLREMPKVPRAVFNTLFRASFRGLCYLASNMDKVDFDKADETLLLMCHVARSNLGKNLFTSRAQSLVGFESPVTSHRREDVAGYIVGIAVRFVRTKYSVHDWAAFGFKVFGRCPGPRESYQERPLGIIGRALFCLSRFSIRRRGTETGLRRGVMHTVGKTLLEFALWLMRHQQRDVRRWRRTRQLDRPLGELCGVERPQFCAKLQTHCFIAIAKLLRLGCRTYALKREFLRLDGIPVVTEAMSMVRAFASPRAKLEDALNDVENDASGVSWWNIHDRHFYKCTTTRKLRSWGRGFNRSCRESVVFIHRMCVLETMLVEKRKHQRAALNRYGDYDL